VNIILNAIPMREAHVFAPGHLTGLFQICTDAEDPLEKGARGAGVSLTEGVHTRVRVDGTDETSYRIILNGQETGDAVVSEYVVSRYLPRLTEPVCITIKHTIETPLTAGFGSSGGGALSLSLALNKALETGLSWNEAAQIAHVAEITCKTGLGSVYASNNGGFGVLFKPGAPGIGDGFTLDDTSGMEVIYLYFGPIHTKEALSDPGLIAKINQIGGSYVDALNENLTRERFLRYARQFTDHVGLASPNLSKVFDLMDPEGYTFTMAMFGEVAYTVQPKEETGRILELLEPIKCEPRVCGVDKHGAIFI
jgi:pantoate kinase